MKYGVEFIFHATFATDETIEQLEQVKHKHYISPAIAARYNTTYEAKDWGITTDVAEMIGNKRELEEGIEVMTQDAQGRHQGAALRRLRLCLAAAGHGGARPGAFRQPVRLRALGGAARGYRLWRRGLGRPVREKMGRVPPGYLADYLLVDGNPLLDLSLLQDRNSLLAIMKDGQFHKSFQGRSAAGMQVAAE